MDKQWTVEKPIEAGYYWAYGNLGPCDADVYMVRIREYDLKYKTCFINGDVQSFHFDHFSHFMGPMKIPDTPQEYNDPTKHDVGSDLSTNEIWDKINRGEIKLEGKSILRDGTYQS